jgi:hypothetical protein
MDFTLRKPVRPPPDDEFFLTTARVFFPNNGTPPSRCRAARPVQESTAHANQFGPIVCVKTNWIRIFHLCRSIATPSP